MRVLAVANAFPLNADDGTAPFMRAILGGLALGGIEVHLLLPTNPELEWDAGEPDGLHLHSYAYLAVGAASWGFGRSLVADRTLARSTVAAAATALPSLAVSMRRLVWRLKPDVVHAHWLVPNGVIAAGISGASPLVISEHGSGLHIARSNRPTLVASRWALSKAAAVTVCSADLADAARDIAPGVEVETIPYGVDVGGFNPGRRNDQSRRREMHNSWGVRDGERVILAVGRLVAKKGFDTLIRAVAEINQSELAVKLVMLGSGDLDRELKSTATELGVEERVHFGGSASRETVAKSMAAADVLAVPSIRDASGNVDGLPNVLLEGMASGIPVVASRIGGIPDVVDHGAQGLLCKPGDVRDLREALTEVLFDEQLAEKLRRGARHRVETELTWAHAVSRYRAVLEGVV